METVNYYLTNTDAKGHGTLKNGLFDIIFLGTAKRGWTHTTWTWGAAEAAGTTSLWAGKEKPPKKRPWNGAWVRFTPFWFLHFTNLPDCCDIDYAFGLDEEMILIGMATRRSSLTLTSGCIKAETTTDHRIAFQISIPERGVAFQHLLLSPTRMTGRLFCHWEHL